MSITSFLAFLTIGLDVSIVVLFHWLLGEKRYSRSMRLLRSSQAVPTDVGNVPSSAQEDAAPQPSQQSALVRPSLAVAKPDSEPQIRRIEHLAHQRIAASLPRPLL
jgi:hypothetical protein